MAGGLGRRAPISWEHVDRYPLTAPTIPAKPTPVIAGVNWYPEFDDPQRGTDGHYFVRAPKPGSRPRGGHCFALKPRRVPDLTAWWDFYNQGEEGACVGFGVTRAMSLMNRRRYWARWLWDQAKLTDEWPETVPGDDNGTSVNAGLRVLRDRGHVLWKASYAQVDAAGNFLQRDRAEPALPEGIRAFRWIRGMDDMLQVLGYDGLDYVDVLNSWGRGYPHLTRFPVSVIEQLWNEDGELGVIVDR
jgi:hypothetical protein